MSMMRMRSVRLSLVRFSMRLLVLVVASCGYQPLPALLDLELLAGNVGGSGNADGVGTMARFGRPESVTVDSAGNLYIADTANHTIRKATPDGVVTTLAGSPGYHGNADGLGLEARFDRPRGVAVDSVGNLYVTDSGSSTIRKVTPAGVVTTLAGFPYLHGSADGSGAAARFHSPAGIAIDGARNLYVADESSHIIRKVTPAGVVTTLAGTAGQYGSANGSGAAARFNYPTGVAADTFGNIYISDSNNCMIRKIYHPAVVTTLAGFNSSFEKCGSVDGSGSAARFDYPSGIAVDKVNNVYIADRKSSTIRKVTASGIVTTLAGAAYMDGSEDGWGTAARFDEPTGVTVDSAGNVYIADQSSSTIRKVTASGVVTTVAGAAYTDGSVDGLGSKAMFVRPSGVAVDRDGNTYVADHLNSTIRKITPERVVTTLAGSADVYGSDDGWGTAAMFVRPSGVAVDRDGNIYVTDRYNYTIRKITLDGVVTTLAGKAGVSGWSDGVGAEARFNSPSGVAVDDVGNVYVAEANDFAIRKVTPDGIVTTLASNGGSGFVDRYWEFPGVAVDNDGNIYVADTKNHIIRKVPPDGVVTTLAGTAGVSGSADGRGAEAMFNSPSGVAVDDDGNVYVTDTYNATIRKITGEGITTTIAGTAGTVGIVLGLTPRFAYPRGLAVVGDSIAISDTNAVLLLHHGAQ